MSLGCTIDTGYLIPSPTTTFTKVIDKLHYKYVVHLLDQQSDSAQPDHTLMERLAFYNSDKYSTAIFSALPRKGTYFTDRQFPECIRTVLGLPSPLFSSFQQQFIGAKDNCIKDPYGIGIANAICSGDHWTHRHDKLKFTLRDILRTAKHTVLVEHGSLFNGKVPTHFYHSFLSTNKRLTPDLFIPHFHNVSDWAGEVKIFNIHSNYKNYINTYTKLTSKTPRMVDHRGPNDVFSAYIRKASTYDVNIAKLPEKTPGPFLQSLHSLHGGHVTPLIGGCFGECSSTIDSLVKECALHAAASDAGLQLTPDTDTSSIFSARNLLLHDFRQVLGCTVLRANIDCKFQRLPFIRSTQSEASNLVHRTNKVNVTTQMFDFNRWFQNVGDGSVYDTFYRFLNQGPFSGGVSLGLGHQDSLPL